MFRTAESVTPNHPDKLCDRISDSILDEALRQDHCHKCSESSCDCESYDSASKTCPNADAQGHESCSLCEHSPRSMSCKPEYIHHGNPLLADGSKCTCWCHPPEDWELEFEKQFVYRYGQCVWWNVGIQPPLVKDFIRSLLRKSFIEGIEKAKELAEDWKPAFGGETDEEVGYQKGLMAEQKLIMSKFDELIKSL